MFLTILNSYGHALCPQIESYFPLRNSSNSLPSLPSNMSGSTDPTLGSRNLTSAEIPTLISSSSMSKTPKPHDLETVFFLNNRDLEVYVTLPNAEKRLFVDIQEEIHPSLFNTSNSHIFGANRATKKAKVDKGEGKSPSVNKDVAPSAQNPRQKDSAKTFASTETRTVATGDQHVQRKALLVKDCNKPKKTDSLALSSAKSKFTKSKVTEKNVMSRETSEGPQSSSKNRLPFATFEQVKLNVRVRPPLPSTHSHGDTKGVKVSALQKKTGKDPIAGPHRSCVQCIVLAIPDDSNLFSVSTSSTLSQHRQISHSNLRQYSSRR